MANTYIVPVSFEMSGVLAIQADSAEDAIRIANENIDSLPVPNHQEYVDGSYSICEEEDIVECYTEEYAEKKTVGGVVPTAFP